MFGISSRKNLVSGFVAFLFLTGLSFDVFPQCGVYLQRKSTQQLPYGRVFLDKSADITGDGLPDLLMSEEDINGSLRERIFMVPNIGNGRFGTAVVFTPPAGRKFSRYYTAGKVNNDNLGDLIVYIDVAPKLVLTYINNGNGTFTQQAPVDASQMGTLSYFLDINNDGIGDYLGYSENQEFRYSLGNGNGTFETPTLITTFGTQPGDYNGDGKIDFLGHTKLILNQGNGVFTEVPIDMQFNSNEAIWGISDFNQDGKSDALVASVSATPRFAIYTSTGSAFARTNYIITTEAGWDGNSTIVNANADAFPDVVFTARHKNKKVVYTNDGAGNLTRTDYDFGFYPYRNDIAYNDFDNDGKTDMVQLTSRTTNGTVMLRDVTSFTFLKNVCNRPGQTLISDYDGRGNTDYSFWDPATGDWKALGIVSGQGQVITVNWGLGSHGDIPTPGDFDGDGYTDRAVYRNSTGLWYIRKSSDLSWFVFQFGLTGDKPVVADYDGDAISDIAVWRPSDGNWHIWYMGPQQYAVIHFGSTGDKPTPADFDGDLKTDIAVYRPSTGAWYYTKSSDGNWVVTQWGISTDRPIPADYDGDGKADLAVHRESDLIAYILRSSDSNAAYFPYGLAGDIFQVGDYDGDFVADLAIYRPSNRTWFSSNTIFHFPLVFGVDNAVPTSTTMPIQ